MEYHIRTYLETDKEQLNQLAVFAFEQYSHLYSDWPEFSRKVARMSALAKNSEILIASQGSTILGAVAYNGPYKAKAEFFKPEWAVIRMLVVNPEYRGSGIGRRLTEECLAHARRDDVQVIALHTSTMMEVALAMYQAMGFEYYAQAPDIHRVKYAIYTHRLTT
ncbi:MAG: GNAT family N-acetyltransferase [Pseudomonadales bacterium]|nr:GNAT family N-acetyltransferase [Pseudomonadales bacterium]